MNEIRARDHKAHTLGTTTNDKDLDLKRALTKDLSHDDAFVTSAAYNSTYGKAPLEKNPGMTPAGPSKGMPYWGVGLGTGVVVGGAAAWGLTVADPHCMSSEECTKRGGCAAGVGAGGGGYCGTGGTGACK